MSDNATADSGTAIHPTASGCRREGRAMIPARAALNRTGPFPSLPFPRIATLI